MNALYVTQPDGSRKSLAELAPWLSHEEFLDDGRSYSVINPLLHMFRWDTRSSVTEALIFDNDDSRKITETELDTLVHPLGNQILNTKPWGSFVVLMDFTRGEEGVFRVELFTRHTTIRQLLERISSGYSCGVMNRLHPLKLSSYDAKQCYDFFIFQ